MQLEVQVKGNKIFAPLKDKWLVNKPEEEVRQKYICRLVNNYGEPLKIHSFPEDGLICRFQA